MREEKKAEPFNREEGEVVSTSSRPEMGGKASYRLAVLPEYEVQHTIAVPGSGLLGGFLFIQYCTLRTVHFVHYTEVLYQPTASQTPAQTNQCLSSLLLNRIIRRAC